MPLPVTHGPSQDRLPGLSQKARKDRAFTLVEVVLALGVFAILIIGCIALLSLSSNSLRDVVTRDEAIHLTTALKQHLNHLSFAASYKLVRDKSVLYVCTYRAKSSGTQTDGTPTGYTGNGRNAGEAYVVVPTVRDAQDALLKSNDLPSREGRIFRVKLSPSLSNPTLESTLPADADTYTESVITVKAQFFPMNGEDPSGPNASVPSQTCTLAVLR
jgi:prepilin-type N-terminal cleavage/methylation domain-containing protein